MVVSTKETKGKEETRHTRPKSSHTGQTKETKSTRKEEGEGGKEGFEFDFGLGKLSIGGLFHGIEKLVDVASKLQEAGGEIRKEQEIDLGNLKEGMKGVFGFSVRTALSGKPVVESFGNIKSTPKGPIIEEQREPITDIFDEKDEIKVYVEMPGVNKADIHLEIKGDILELSGQREKRKYHKEILLPSKVEAETMTSNYKNGILEVKMKKM